MFAIHPLSMKHIVRKGQNATEFVILAGFMILVFLLFFVVIQQKIIEATEEKNDAAAEQIMSIVTTEIKTAESVTDDYYRTFSVPSSLNGLPYNISIISGIAGSTEIVITYAGKERVYFLDQYVNANSTVGKGKNNITKSQGIISLSKTG